MAQEQGSKEERLAQALQQVADKFDRFAEFSNQGNTNSQNIKIHAGGVGIWIATTCCLIMLAVIFVGGLWLSREFTAKDKTDAQQAQQISDLNAYLQAIYVNAPDLKPKKE